MEEKALVDVLYTIDQLDGKHENCLEAELSPTLRIQRLKALAQQIHNHYVAFSCCSAPVDIGYSSS